MEAKLRAEEPLKPKGGLGARAVKAVANQADDIALAASKSHNEKGGSTFHPVQGDMSGKPAFAVAGSYPKLSQVIEGEKITPEQYKAYASRPDVAKVLADDPKASIGTWAHDGKTDLEVSEVHNDRNTAIAAGKKNNQIAIHSLADHSDVPTGGTGTRPLELTHYSDVAGLKETNPEMHGTGVRGAERSRMKEPGYLPRTYFGTEGYREPAVQGKPYSYKAQIDPSKIYDIAKDPEGIWQEGFAKGGATGAENAIHDAGYAGYQHDGVVAAFDRMPVTGANLAEAGRTEGVPVLPTEKVGGSRISQRNPTAVKATENPVTEDLQVGLDAIKKSDESKPGFVSKLAATVAKYPGVPISEELAQADPEKALNLFVNHISDNLQWLHNQIPENVRNISKLWYDSAHQLTKEWAAKYGVTHEQMAGAVAALSPQNEWNNNVETANRVADILKNKQNFDWSPEMQTKASQLAARSPDLGKVMQDVMGKKLSDLDNPYDKAAWIRVYDESHNARSMPNYAPDGSIRGLARNPVSRQPTVSHWNSTSGIATAVSILEDGSKENIHKSLGDMHKVRNFYNNIIDPWSKSGDVTIDTHAVGAGHLRPMGGSSEEVKHNFGASFKPTPAQVAQGMKASSSQGSAVTGVQGTYGLYAEAYRQAAKKLGILPRELQSITWEGIRSLYESRAKTDELKSTISQIWKDHKNGEVSIDRARQQILKAAGGFKNPKWLSDIGQNGAEGATPK